MSRAELLRRHAHECELRARALADRADPADQTAARRYFQASDAEAICARVLLELAQVEDEDTCDR